MINSDDEERERRRPNGRERAATQEAVTYNFPSPTKHPSRCIYEYSYTFYTLYIHASFFRSQREREWKSEHVTQGDRESEREKYKNRHTYTQAHLYTRTHIQMHEHKYLHTHTCKHTYIHMCARTHAPIHNLHTHTHQCTRSNSQCDRPLSLEQHVSAISNINRDPPSTTCKNTHTQHMHAHTQHERTSITHEAMAYITRTIYRGPSSSTSTPALAPLRDAVAGLFIPSIVSVSPLSPFPIQTVDTVVYVQIVPCSFHLFVDAHISFCTTYTHDIDIQHTYAHTSTRTPERQLVHTHAQIISSHTHKHMYTHTFTHTHAHTHTHTLTHTHTRTHMCTRTHAPPKTPIGDLLRPIRICTHVYTCIPRTNQGQIIHV